MYCASTGKFGGTLKASYVCSRNDMVETLGKSKQYYKNCVAHI